MCQGYDLKGQVHRDVVSLFADDGQGPVVGMKTDVGGGEVSKRRGSHWPD